MRAWRRPLIVAGYLFYAVVLFAVFAYLKFPSQEARAMVLTALHRYGLEQVRIQSVQPLPLVGVAFRDVRYVGDMKGQALDLLRTPELRLYLRTLVPFSNPLRLRFEGDLYGGTLAGTIAWQQDGQGAMVEVQAQLRDIRPGVHPAVARWGNAAVEGKLIGDLTLRLPNPTWQAGEGRLTLQGDGGRVTGLEIAGIQLPPLAYEQVSGDMVWQTRSVMVRDFLIRGRDWQFDVQGQLNLANHLPESILDVTVRVRVSDTLEQQLGLIGAALKQRRDRRGFSSFSIGGTLAQPTFVL
jgi:type II secretion system protein N